MVGLVIEHDDVLAGHKVLADPRDHLAFAFGERFLLFPASENLAREL
jgi:hypothetical protein